MKFNPMKYVPKRMTRTVASTIMKTKIHSPSILFVAGTTGMVASTVLACRATLKLEDVLSAGHAQITETELLRDGVHPDKPAGTYEYSPETQASDVRIIRIRTAVEVAKIYAPAAIVGILSIAALTKSHHIMRDRNAQLAAAFATVSEAMSEYRKRVAAEFGEDKERELYHGVVEEDVVEVKDGKITKRTKKTAAGAGPYAVFLTHENKNWNKDPWMTLTFIRCQEKFANDKLQADGFLVLNDIYDALGVPRTEEGMVVGWVYDKFNHVNELNGDNHIDLGVWSDDNLDKFHDFMVGAEGQILIDPNPDGNIHELLMKRKHGKKALA